MELLFLLVLVGVVVFVIFGDTIRSWWKGESVGDSTGIQETLPPVMRVDPESGKIPVSSAILLAVAGLSLTMLIGYGGMLVIPRLRFFQRQFQFQEPEDWDELQKDMRDPPSKQKVYEMGSYFRGISSRKGWDKLVFDITKELGDLPQIQRARVTPIFFAQRLLESDFQFSPEEGLDLRKRVFNVLVSELGLMEQVDEKELGLLATEAGLVGEYAEDAIQEHLKEKEHIIRALENVKEIGKNNPPFEDIAEGYRNLLKDLDEEFREKENAMEEEIERETEEREKKFDYKDQNVKDRIYLELRKAGEIPGPPGTAFVEHGAELVGVDVGESEKSREWYEILERKIRETCEDAKKRIRRQMREAKNQRKIVLRQEKENKEREIESIYKGANPTIFNLVQSSISLEKVKKLPFPRYQG